MHLEITGIFWGFYLQKWIFNSFSVATKYLYEDCTIGKFAATAKFCPNYEINFFKGCHDVMVSGVQSSWPKEILFAINPLHFSYFWKPFSRVKSCGNSKKVENDGCFSYSANDSKRKVYILQPSEDLLSTENQPDTCRRVVFPKIR